MERVIAVLERNPSISLHASLPDWAVPQTIQISVLDGEFMEALGMLNGQHLDRWTAKALEEFRNLWWKVQATTEM